MSVPVVSGPSASSSGPAPSLTPRELELLTRVANGETYIQIARDWVVEEVTVRGTGFRVLRKLGANNITHAVLLACRAGILDGRPQRHGDHAGYAAHVYRKEDPCPACRAGESKYRAEQRAARKATQRDAA